MNKIARFCRKNAEIDNKNKFFLIHLNIRSITNKFDFFKELVKELFLLTILETSTKALMALFFLICQIIYRLLTYVIWLLLTIATNK